MIPTHTSCRRRRRPAFSPSSRQQKASRQRPPSEGSARRVCTTFGRFSKVQVFITSQTSIMCKCRLIWMNVSGVEIIVVVHQTWLQMLWSDVWTHCERQIMGLKQKELDVVAAVRDLKSLCNWVLAKRNRPYCLIKTNYLSPIYYKNNNNNRTPAKENSINCTRISWTFKKREIFSLIFKCQRGFSTSSF